MADKKGGKQKINSSVVMTKNVKSIKNKKPKK